MLKQISILTKVQLANFCNVNVFRYTKDKKKKYTMMALGMVWILLILMVLFYVGGMSYGYIFLGLSDVLPMCLVAISAMFIFLFGMLKAGSVIFQKNGYDMICALPVSQTAIVVSRFLSMYLGNLLLALCVMLPGMAVYGYLLRPGIGFYVMGLVGVLFLPLLPMTAATLFGAVITAISSRMKHTGLVSTVLTIGALLVFMMFTSNLTALEEEFSMEMLQDLMGPLTNAIGNLYPPALWMGKAMTEGAIGYGVLYLGVSIVFFVITIAIVSVYFQTICRRLYSTSAKHNYKLKKMERRSMLIALFKKEWKRYFSSGNYVSNTILGPVLMVVMAVAVLVMGADSLEQMLPVPGGITGIIPFAMAMTCCLMTTTCTSVSMEGKNWWITTSLPIPVKTLLDGKILLNLALIAPFYVVAEILLVIALKPDFMDLLWQIILPAAFILFAAVFGITVNLLFPVFDWENDVTVVKQSASALIGGIGGPVLILLSAVPLLLLPQVPADILKLIILIVILLLTAGLYYRNSKVSFI